MMFESSRAWTSDPRTSKHESTCDELQAEPSTCPYLYVVDSKTAPLSSTLRFSQLDSYVSSAYYRQELWMHKVFCTLWNLDQNRNTQHGDQGAASKLRKRKSSEVAFIVRFTKWVSGLHATFFGNRCPRALRRPSAYQRTLLDSRPSTLALPREGFLLED